jgi:hypothetical protein
MISDEPTPTTMPPANNSAAKIFVFMSVACLLKIEKEKRGSSKAALIRNRCQSGVICIGSGT